MSPIKSPDKYVLHDNDDNDSGNDEKMMKKQKSNA